MKKEKLSSFGPLGQAVPEGHPVSAFLCLYNPVNLFCAQARLNWGSCHRRWRRLMAASLLASKSPSWDEYKTAILASPPRGWVRFISCFPFSPFSSLPQRKLQKPLRNGISKGEGTLSSDTNEVSGPVPARPSTTQRLSTADSALWVPDVDLPPGWGRVWAGKPLVRFKANNWDMRAAWGVGNHTEQ